MAKVISLCANRERLVAKRNAGKLSKQQILDNYWRDRIYGDRVAVNSRSSYVMSEEFMDNLIVKDVAKFQSPLQRLLISIHSFFTGKKA